MISEQTLPCQSLRSRVPERYIGSRCLCFATRLYSPDTPHLHISMIIDRQRVTRVVAQSVSCGCICTHHIQGQSLYAGGRLPRNERVSHQPHPMVYCRKQLRTCSQQANQYQGAASQTRSPHGLRPSFSTIQRNTMWSAYLTSKTPRSIPTSIWRDLRCRHGPSRSHMVGDS